MSNPFDIVRNFEQAVCGYTGAKYCVAVNSCTLALLLAVAWHLRDRPKVIRHYDGGPDPDYMLPEVFSKRIPDRITVNQPLSIEIPKRTYVSVPMSIIHAGGRPAFRDEEWKGAYQLKPLPVWDSARWFSWKMYEAIRLVSSRNTFVPSEFSSPFICVSFHAAKTLGDTQGGAILHDNAEADAWLRRARFDGRTEGVAPKDDTFTQIGYHCYMSPDVAARLMWKLKHLPMHNEPLPNDDYPDLSQMDIFK